MINIVVPMAGGSEFFKEARYPFPKPLAEINSKTMIELFLENMNQIEGRKRYIFVVNSADCERFHLDNVLNLLTNNSCHIIKIASSTQGAAASILMAIDFINNDDEMIISNYDQYIDASIKDVLQEFNDVDAGVITFRSIHPKWSFIKVDKDNMITEVAEKKPLSDQAIAGLYYFSKGSSFVSGAMSMIKKGADINGAFFIAPVLNEIILENKRLGYVQIPAEQYHTFYTPKKITEYETSRSRNLLI